MKSPKADPLPVLAAVSRIMAGSLDYETILTAVARLALPYLGGWCVVDLQEEDGTVRRLAVIHPEPDMQVLARELEAGGWPPERDDPHGIPAVIASRRTVAIARVDDDLLVRVAHTPEVLARLRALGIGSLITVPLVARDSVIGAITFIGPASGREYDADDVTLAEHLAALAALALDNSRLHLAALGRAKAEAADHAKSEFLATMSHEIRTPINAMLGYTELLELGLAGPITTKQREILGRIRVSGAHLVGLVTDVLDLAKVEAGQLEVGREPGITGPAVATALALALPSAQSKGIRLVDTSCEPAGVPYLGDAQRVRQIVVNLVTNASNFTPRGGVVTVASGTATSVPPGAVCGGEGPWSFIRVSDTGPGVPAEQQAAVFEPFVQANAGLTRRHGGTGLGLTISRRLARLMGGDLTLESEPGHGATFTLWLPGTSETDQPVVDRLMQMANAGTGDALSGAALRAYGLTEIGGFLRQHVADVVTAIGARLRTDPDIPQAATLRTTELEDHHFALLADVAQSLVVIGESGGAGSDVSRDGSEIQRLVSDLHGRMRHRQGWTAAQLQRESALVAEEVQSSIRGTLPGECNDAEASLEVVEHLLEQASQGSLHAFRLALELAAPQRRPDGVLPR